MAYDMHRAEASQKPMLKPAEWAAKYLVAAAEAGPILHRRVIRPAIGVVVEAQVPFLIVVALAAGEIFPGFWKCSPSR